MRSWINIFFFVFAFGIFGWIDGYAQSNLQIIGNKTGYSSLPIKEARQVFKVKYSTWATGKPVVIVLPSPKHPRSEEVCKLMYETTPSGVQKFWLSLVFQGRANPPLFFDSDEEILNYVSKNTGAIGIVSKEGNKIDPLLLINLVN